MFTSRSEHRLLLRSDNADQRLTPLGISIGCVSEYRKKLFLEKNKKIKKGIETASKLTTTPNKLSKFGIKINLDGKKRSILDLLAFSNISFSKLEEVWPQIKELDLETREQILIEARYAGYLNRQRLDIQDFKKDENLKIPNKINYKKVGSLSNEVVEKLTKIKPPTLGAASRISGITPAAIIAILRFIKRSKNKKAA